MSIRVDCYCADVKEQMLFAIFERVFAVKEQVRKLIDSLTQDIIEAYTISIPLVDIDAFVEELGGKVIKETGISDGSVQKTGDSFVIKVSSFQDERRRRFTIAHELGHLFLHMGFRTCDELWQSSKEVYYREGTSEQEYQANEFAASLLMPKREYLNIFKSNTAADHTVNIMAVADYFNVSIEAALNRGKFLELIEW